MQDEVLQDIQMFQNKMSQSRIKRTTPPWLTRCSRTKTK
jgi:hypothetical protein